MLLIPWLRQFSNRFFPSRLFQRTSLRNRRSGHSSPCRLALLEQLEDRVLLSSTTDPTGNDQPYDGRQPSTAITYAIALVGIFPQRDNGTPISPLAAGGAEPFLGEVLPFPYNFVPRGFAACNGQVLSITQNDALFALLGTTYGGDGITTFALPDLRGRTPIGAGTGPSLTPIQLGEKSGVESETLTVDELPAHDHTVGGQTTGSTGNGQPVDNMMPTLGLNPIIDGNSEIAWVPYNFAPDGTALANGQLLPIAQNAALFSEIGTTYGGDGVNTFALPDLRGRVALDDGLGTGLTNRPTGSLTGEESVTLTTENIPPHTHDIPGGGVTGSTGGGQAFDNMQPSIALNFQIATLGIFPSRNLTLDETDLAAVGSDGQALSQADADAALSGLVDAGIAHWAATGISTDEIATLESATYQFGSLDPGILAAVTGPDVVTIDLNAAGQSWFVDSTPTDDSEFGESDPQRGLLATTVGAESGIDLLTVLMHEQGHLLGLDHVPTPGDLMSATLGVGERRLPTAGEVPTLHDTFEPSDLTLFYTPFLGAIHMFASATGPSNGFASTSGQIRPIVQETALFALLGTFYGGNGTSTFAYPDFQGRVLVGVGQGPGLSSYDVGQLTGSETVQLTVGQLPSHTHTLPAIVNATGTVQFTTGTKSVSEADGSQSISVSLTGTGILAQDVTVPIIATDGSAIAGSDYSLTTTSVTFAAGTDLSTNPTQNVTFAISQDQLIEGTEGFTLNLGTITAPGDVITTGVTTSNSVTIADDDSASVSINGGATVTEGGSSSPITATLHVTTDGVAGGTATLAAGVAANLAGNSDYSSTAASFLAGAGDNATANITVSAIQDQLIEGTETFPNQTLTVTGVATANGTGQTITVNDDDSATVSISSGTTVTEGGPSSPITATLHITTDGVAGGIATLPAGVTANLAGNSDYSSTAASFPAGAGDNATSNIAVSAIQDQLIEGTETFPNQTLTVTGVATASGFGQTITVQDDDSIVVSIDTGATVTEGGASVPLTATLHVTTDGVAGGTATLASVVTANLPVNSDYSSTAATFLAGAGNNATATINVSAVQDQLIEGTETFAGQALIVSGPATAGGSSQTITVIDDDSATVSISNGATVTEGGASSLITATLHVTTNGVPGGTATLVAGVTAKLPGNSDYSSTAASFPAGAGDNATANITVSAIQDQLIEGTETFPNQALIVTGVATASGSGQTITVLDDDRLLVKFNQFTGSGLEAAGNGLPKLLITGTIQTGDTVSINLSVDATSTASIGDYTGPTTLVVGPGTYSATPFAIPGLSVLDDSADEPNETIVLNNITGSAVTAGTPGSTTYTILNDDRDQLSVSAPVITESNVDQTVTFLVTSPFAVQGGFDVAISATDGTATSGDYTLVTKTVHFNGIAGEMQPVSVKIKGDTIVEADETFKLTLGAVTGTSATQQAVILTGASATATIINDDTDTLSITAPTIKQTTVSGRLANLSSGSPIVVFTITSPNAVQGGFDVAITTTDGTAGSSDYTLITRLVHFNGTAGETQQVQVRIIGDSIVEGNETFSVNLSTVTNTTATQKAAITTGASANAVIIDDDVAPAPTVRAIHLRKRARH